MNSKPTAPPTTVESAGLLPRFIAAIIDTFVAWHQFHLVSALIISTTFNPERTAITGLIAGAFFLINIGLLVKRGQTFGKVIMGIQIVDFHDNRLLPFFQIFILRHNFLLPLIVSSIWLPGPASYFLLWLFMNLDAAPIFFERTKMLS